MPADSSMTRHLHTAAAVLVALAMFAAASGSGTAPPGEGLPDWIDTLANVAAAAAGVLVLVPRTRLAGAGWAVVLMLLALPANYVVDGPAFFVKALPFNLVSLALAGVVIRRELARRDAAP